MISLNPIGIFHSSITETCQSPYQTGVLEEQLGYIELEAQQNYEQALADLDGFDTLWLIFLFDRVGNWKTKIKTPRDPQKRGLFATRSPHRPNPIGLSSVKLKKIVGRKIYIEDHDLLDGTPILDIKPYLSTVDCHPEASLGWLEGKERPAYELRIPETVQTKLDFLSTRQEYQLLAGIECTLRIKPFPDKENRIIQLDNELREIAYKTWRFSFSVDEGNNIVHLHDLYSGYSEEYLSGEKKSKWPDVPAHQVFQQRFSS